MSKHGQTLAQLRDHSDDELTAQLATTRDELFRLKLGQYTNQVTSTAGLLTKRRDIARILTVLNGRKAGTEKQAQKSEAAPAATETAAPTKKSSKKKKAE